MEPLHLAVIGVGGMGGGHARSVGKLAEVKLTCVADINPDIANRVGEETGARPYTDWQAMMREERARGLEAVVIATPHPFHPVMAEYAAAQGLHVLSEKPLAVSVKAADGMIKACQEAGVLLGAMFQQRVTPSRRIIKQMVEEGAIGAVHRVSMVAPWYRPQAYYNAGAWRGTWNGEGGGILMNQAPHSIDMLAWIAGMPRSVQGIAATRLHQIEVESMAVALCDYGEGNVGWFYASTADVPVSEVFEIAGDRGILRWEGGKVSFFELEESLADHLRTATAMFGHPKGSWRDVPVEGTDEGHNAVVRAFAQAVRANDPSLMVASGQDGLNTLELANAMLMAGYTRRQVTLPLDRDAYESMLEQLREGVKPEDLKE